MFGGGTAVAGDPVLGILHMACTSSIPKKIQDFFNLPLTTHITLSILHPEIEFDGFLPNRKGVQLYGSHYVYKLQKLAAEALPQ